uniref:Uncharacterized protein n=1 Tax=Rhizophora mucronata TaxID=61149 RepID=A0A2P2Q0N4_RHIMU
MVNNDGHFALFGKISFGSSLTLKSIIYVLAYLVAETTSL